MLVGVKVRDGRKAFSGLNICIIFISLIGILDMLVSQTKSEPKML